MTDFCQIKAKNEKPHGTDALMSCLMMRLLIYWASKHNTLWYCSEIRHHFHFFTSWITSSSSNTWSLPTFWGLCLTDDPHTRALKEEKNIEINLTSSFELRMRWQNHFKIYQKKNLLLKPKTTWVLHLKKLKIIKNHVTMFERSIP